MKVGSLLAAVIAITILAGLVIPTCKKAEPTLPSFSASEIIDNSGERISKVNSFHFEITHVGGGTPLVKGLEMNEAIGDIVKPGKIKTSISATIGLMLVEVDVITIGKTTYMTNPLNKEWELLPNEFSAISLFDPDTSIAAILKDMTDLTKLNDEKIDGISCYHIKGKVPCESLRPITLSSIEGVKIDTEVWIDKEEFLLHQIRLKGKITDTEKPGIIREIKLSNFDQEVEIELPR